MNSPHPRRGSRLGSAPVSFTFDGRRYAGIAGDTAASALLANGVQLLGRSVKYRRPRGLMSAGPEEPNALLTVGTAPTLLPNVPAPRLPIADGQQLMSQNRWPTLRFDLASLLGIGGSLWGAGFYYKTFMWPSWRSYEGIIRRLAGLGSAPGACQLPAPRTEHLQCDVLVIGAGAAGLAAARVAMQAGATVVVCEREPVCGGELEFETANIEGLPAPRWIAETCARLEAGGARLLLETVVVGGSGGLSIAHREPGGRPEAATVFRIRPRALVIATGAVERPIAFIDNDRPGVMLVGAAERLLAGFGVCVGRRVVLFGNHDRLYAAARRLMAGGMRIAAVVDVRPRHPDLKLDDLLANGVECLFETAVLAAVGAPGVRAAKVAPLASPDSARNIDCDAILVSGGWTPSTHAGLHEGGVRQFAPELSAFVAGAAPAWRVSCGAANGQVELSRALEGGHQAGLTAAAQARSLTVEHGAAPVGRGDAAPQLLPFWRCSASRADEKRQFVDLQNDVTVADLRQALAEGFQDIEHVKRYTALGFGTEQGRTSGVLGAAILAELSQRPLATVGVSRTRAPFQPATLATLCGDRHGWALRPERRTPLHEWHGAHGGELESMGLWMRPRFYRENGSDAFSAGIHEAARVRAHGGIADGSTLGKIEVCGADAAAFLDRMYLTKASTIRVGRSKYMVMLREDGMVLDDGIVLRLAADRFVATVSSGHAGHVLSHLEFWRDLEFAARHVTLTDVTEAWNVIVVAGPRSSGTLQTILGSEWQAELTRLGHMDFSSGRWRGRELRVLRASFSGERAYELHCRPAITLPLWEALVAAGLAPYGLEAMDVLRVEKGYLVGTEMNGQTTPQDLGMGSLLRLGNTCVGRELLDRQGLADPERPRLVGLRAADEKSIFYGGAQITRPEEQQRACGHVTSSVYSPALGQWIGLALVSRSIGMGAELIARDPVRGRQTRVLVSSPVHVDPAGEKMK